MNITHKLLVRLSASLAVFFIVVTCAMADIIKDNSFQASSNGVNVTIHWITDQEPSVARFEVQRRSGTDGAFTTIGTLDPKGPSLYEFVDNTAFRKVTTLYQYRIVVVFNNGSAPVVSTAISVSHTVSGVRRTWGSIKAMFR
jgi:hypothetical protein